MLRATIIDNMAYIDWFMSQKKACFRQNNKPREVKVLLTKALSEYLYLELSPCLEGFLFRSLLQYTVFIFKFLQNLLESTWSVTLKAEKRILQDQLLGKIRSE